MCETISEHSGKHIAAGRGHWALAMASSSFTASGGFWACLIAWGFGGAIVHLPVVTTGGGGCRG